MRDDMTEWLKVPTRYRDLDPNNHVNNTVYFIYIEMARMNFFRKSGVLDLREVDNMGIPVVSQTCNYRAQVYHPSTLDVGIRCEELREKTVHLAYKIYLEDTDTLVADGVSVSVWVDLDAPKAIPLPEELRKAILDFDGMGSTLSQ